MFPQYRIALTLLFFLSGAVALVYEVLWQRLLTLNFGISSFATATILAAFMGGLALGSFIAERWAPGLKRPARVYAKLEVGVGIYALILPWLLEGVMSLYGPIYGSVAASPTLHGLIMAALFFLLLLPPTAMMGATFPILVEAVTEAGGGREQLGWLYGINCGGAFLGCLVTAFILLPGLGLRGSTLLGVGISLGVGAIAWALDAWAEGASGFAEVLDGGKREGSGGSGIKPDPDPSSPGPGVWALSLGAALTGAAAMIYELAFFRLLTLQIGSSVYGFSLMLSAFLLGLTLGSIGAGLWLKARPKGGAAGFVVTQLMAGGVVVCTHLAIPELPIVYVRLVELFGQGSIGSLAILLFSGSVLMPAALGLGASLPLAAAAASGVGRGDVTRGAARIYGANTIGAVGGTLAGGFGLLPAFGVQGALEVGVALNLLGALGVALPRWAPGERRGRGLVVGALGGGIFGVGILLQPPWDPMWMSAGIYQDLEDLVGRPGEEIKEWAKEGAELLYYAEGLNTAVTVGVGTSSGNIWLANNGKVDASSLEDMDTQLMLAHIPMGLHPRAERVGVIGLASGATVGAVTHYPAKAIDVLELEPAIVEASHFFDEVNDRPLEDPRVSLHLMDARRYLRWEEASFDVLISEPSNPWISGVSNLFTEEFFHLAKARLAPGGLLCQWIQLYELSQSDLKILLRTIQKVFPEVLLFGSLESADLIVIASAQPLEFGPRQFEEAFARPGVRRSLRRLRFIRPEDVLGWYITGSEGVRRFAGEGPINTDDNAWIEMRAPLYLSKLTADINFQGLVDIHEGPEGLFGDTLGADSMLSIAESYLMRDLFKFSADAAKRAINLGVTEEELSDFKYRFKARYDAYPYQDASAP